MEDINNLNRPNGYVINLFQYARRYEYNYRGMLDYFNDLVKKHRNNIPDPNYLCFGDFDCIEVIPIDTFRKFHDVSKRAKDWLGRRQSVLLYNIEDEECPAVLYYNQDTSNSLEPGKWRFANSQTEPPQKNFFCLSMLSLTNETIAKYGQETEQSCLIKKIRRKILALINEIQKNQESPFLTCEVFGTFNPSEIAIVWLVDQYTDVLQIIDYLKHIYCKEGENKTPVFLNSFSVIAQSDEAQGRICNGVQIDKKARALIQIAIHDAVKSYDEVQKLANSLIPEECKDESKIYYSVGEYDIVIELPAQKVFSQFAEEGKLSIGKRNIDGRYLIEKREILRNNTRLVYDLDENDTLQIRLKELFDKGQFELDELCFSENLSSASPVPNDELEELIEYEASSSLPNPPKNNLFLYNEVRKRLKNIAASSGMIDILDLLYTDYRSAIGIAYSAMWASDLHRQFKAVLNVILELLPEVSEKAPGTDSKTDGTENKLYWRWDDYLELHNAFKQQISHLTQSNRMFFETPSCHLRATGQFDYLMHTYYGIVKKILNLIYLLQCDGKQSELVPFITVNIVPQVKTQIFYEHVVDAMRVLNVDIPQAIIFNPYRGAHYLCHELFHHAAPVNRETRNREMGKLLLSVIMQVQFEKIFDHMAGISGSENDKRDILRSLYFDDNPCDSRPSTLSEAIIAFVESHYAEVEKTYIFSPSSDTDLLCSLYQKRLFDFTQSDKSNGFFFELFKHLLDNIWERRRDKANQPVYSVLLGEKLQKIYACVQYYRMDKEGCKAFIISHQPFRQAKGTHSADIKTPYNLWDGLREACCDVAMITMTGMSKVDYLLFCIQAWVDVYRDQEGQQYSKEQHKDALRTSIVLLYCGIYGLSAWEKIRSGNGKTSFEIVTDAEKQEFLRRYIAFYYHGSFDTEEAEKILFDKLKKEAEDWLQRFRDHYWDFSINKLVFFAPMKQILDDYNVNLRIQKISNPDNQEAAKGIQEEFTAKMQEYSRFLRDIPISSMEFTDQTDSDIHCHRQKAFSHDLELAGYFQKQISLRELAKLNESIRETLEKSNKTKSTETESNKTESNKTESNESIRKTPNTETGQSADSSSMTPSPNNLQTASSSSVSQVNDEWKFRAYNLSQLQFYLRHCATILLGKDQARNKDYCVPSNLSTIWYRGQSSEKYALLPTVVRQYHQDKYRKIFPTLRSFQEHLYNEFKFRADGALEATADGEYTISDYIALMQHYQETTNFLDWTENAFKSLYFALENNIKDLRKQVDPAKRVKKSVTITLFNPMTYNRQRNQVISKLSLNPYWSHEPFFEKIHENEVGRYYKMPNLSVAKDAEYYDAFLLGDRDFDRFTLPPTTSAYLNYLDCVKSHSMDKELFLPLAIWTSRWNPRIRAQSGCFVAFNLYMPPDLPPLDPSPSDPYPNIFKYMSLDQIQDRFCRYFNGEMFMYQIVIDESCCDEVAKWLTEGMGMSDSDVYPDLSKLKERFK